jgi:hypothetical protein
LRRLGGLAVGRGASKGRDREDRQKAQPAPSQAKR